MGQRNERAVPCLIFELQSGEEIVVRLEDNSLWLTQPQIAALFAISANTVSDHLSKVFNAGELQRAVAVRRLRVQRNEGGRVVERELSHYRLDAVLAVGFRVQTPSAISFRHWAIRALCAQLCDDLSNTVRDKRGAGGETKDAFSLRSVEVGP